MSAPALWTKYRGIALGIARDYYLPGSDSDDVRQEAMIALWQAARTFDRTRGTFPAWARVVIHRHLTDCLRTATRGKQNVLTLAVRDGRIPFVTDGEADHRQAVRELVASARNLSQPERAALIRIIDGSPLEGKADDNLRYRVRKKLRASGD